MSNAVLDVNEKPSSGQLITLSFQHMFAMFGSTILVPQLVGLSPAIALLNEWDCNNYLPTSYTISSASIFRFVLRIHRTNNYCSKWVR